MQRPYVTLPRAAFVDSPEGGSIGSASNEVYAPTELVPHETGLAFGPLSLGIPSGTATIGSLNFGAGDDGLLDIKFLGVMAGLASSQRRLNRRQVVAIAGTLLTSAAVGVGEAAAQEEGADKVALEVATVELTSLTTPLDVRLIDTVDRVLPPTADIYVDVDGGREDELGDPADGVQVASGSETVKVYLADSASRLDRLLAWARGVIGGDEELLYSDNLPDGMQANEYAAGTLLKLTEHPAVVEPLRESPEDSLLRVGRAAIPHETEVSGESEVGVYGVFGDSLIYQVGEEAPSASEWSIRLRASLLTKLQHDLNQS